MQTGSDLELSDDDDDDVFNPSVNDSDNSSNDESSSDDERVENVNDPVLSISKSALKKAKQTPWSAKKVFNKVAINEPDVDIPTHKIDWTPRQYFDQYFNDEMYTNMAENTNLRSVEDTTRSLNTTAAEIKRFIGISFLMSALSYPQIKMYWAGISANKAIVSTMARDRYFNLRSRLKIVNDNEVSEDVRKQDLLWKVRPLIDSVRNMCLQLNRSTKVSIDE